MPRACWKSLKLTKGLPVLPLIAVVVIVFFCWLCYFSSATYCGFFFLLIPFLFMYDNEEGLKSRIKSWSKSLFISSFTTRFCLSQSHLICLKKGSFHLFFLFVKYDLAALTRVIFFFNTRREISYL